MNDNPGEERSSDDDRLFAATAAEPRNAQVAPTVAARQLHEAARRTAPSVAAATTGDHEATREAFRHLFPGVMVAMFLASADQTILASALPVVARQLDGFEYVSWVVVGYLLAATIAAPVYGHLGDRFGRKPMLLIALAIFTAASLVCALAPTLLALVLGRALQGLGGGGLMTLSQALIGEHVAPRDRGRYQGYFAGVFALASTSGPIAGAYLTEHVSWRAVFAINLPLGIVAALLARRIPAVKPARAGKYAPDFVGLALFCVATLGLLLTVSAAGHVLAFDAWPLYASLAVVVALYVVLFAWEARTEHPIIPVRLLRRAEIARPDAVVMCFAAALFASVLYLPLYLQIGRGLGVGASGTLLLPITLSMVTGAIVTGRLVSRTGRVTVFPVIGLALATAALLALAAALARLPTSGALALTSATGFGLGMVMPALQVAVQHAAGRDSLGSAIGAMSLSRSIGGAVGVALIGAIVVASLAHTDAGLAATMTQVIDAGPQALATLDPAQRAALVERLDGTFRLVFLVVACVTCVGAVVATTIPKPRL